MLLEAIECCECSLPVGDEEEMRTVLIVPCQHVIHHGCSDYIRKWRKIQQILRKSGTGGFPPHHGDGSESTDAGRLASCPSCSMPATRLIPLYPSRSSSSGSDRRSLKRASGDAGQCDPREDMASTGADNTTTDKRNQVALFKKVNQLQKLCIRHGRSLCTQQQNLVQLNITCATLSERQSAAERQLDHFSSIIPNMLDSKETPRFVGDELPADDMTATELELYIAHSSAAVRNLERDISEQNSILGRKKRKLADLHEKYQAAVSRSRKRCRTSEGSKCEERGRTRDSRLSALLSSSDAEGDLRPSKLRENRPSFVLVDSHENSTANDQQPFIISSGESSDVEEVARNGSGGGEREVVIIEDSPARSLVSGGSTPRRISARGSEQRGQSENFRGASGGVPGELGSEEDVTWFSRAQRVRSTIQNVLIPNVARILPRRVDRLFQSSLGGF